MGSLRFFRSQRGEPTVRSGEPVDALDAFASDTAPVVQGTSSEPGELLRNARLVIGVLTALVILQAVPTVLWVAARLQPAAAASALAPPAPALAPAVVAAPCEVAPATPSKPTPAAAGVSVVAASARVSAAPPPPPARMLAGLVAVTAPVPMLVYERGRLVGTTEAETMMLGVGSHDLEFVNEDVGFRVLRTVNVQAGQTLRLGLSVPMGRVHINAVPWAEVWIDNERVGETPIGNFETRIGNREVVFRHPELGERRASVTVTLIRPARISMDMRNK